MHLSVKQHLTDPIVECIHITHALYSAGTYVSAYIADVVPTKVGKTEDAMPKEHTEFLLQIATESSVEGVASQDLRW